MEAIEIPNLKESDATTQNCKSADTALTESLRSIGLESSLYATFIDTNHDASNTAALGATRDAGYQNSLQSPHLKYPSLQMPIRKRTPMVSDLNLCDYGVNEAPEPDICVPVSDDEGVSTPAEPTGIDLDKWPRIPITSTMIHVYSLMKGPNPDVRNDVLHSALFATQYRQHGEHQVWLPGSGGSSAIDELPKGTKYYWDPVIQVKLPDRSATDEQLDMALQGALRSTSSQHANLPLAQPYSEGLKENKGEEILESFGYLNINKNWVDPDDHAELHNAYSKSGKDKKAADTKMSQKTSDSGLPPLEPPGAPFDNYKPKEIMDKFYEDFNGFVSDDEGDPQQYHMSPKTFARFATSSKFPTNFFGDLLHSTPKTKEEDSWNTSTDTEAKTEKHGNHLKPNLQFDVETGSAMTGVYHLDSEPSLREEAEGVDPVRPPNNYAMMNPLAALNINKKAFAPAYFDHHQRDINVSAHSSTQEYLNSEEGVEMLAQPGFPDTGLREYIGAQGTIHSLVNEGYKVAGNNNNIFTEMDNANLHRSDLYREIQLLERRLKTKPKNPNLKKAYKRDYMYATDSEASASKAEDTSTSVPVETTRSSSKSIEAKWRRKQQYKRHVAEQIATRTMEVEKQRVMGVKLQSELDEILEEIVCLQEVRDGLLADLGVKDVSEIPGLVPQRNDPGESSRAQLNKRLQNQG